MGRVTRRNKGKGASPGTEHGPKAWRSLSKYTTLNTTLNQAFLSSSTSCNIFRAGIIFVLSASTDYIRLSASLPSTATFSPAFYAYTTKTCTPKPTSSTQRSRSASPHDVRSRSHARILATRILAASPLRDMFKRQKTEEALRGR